MESSVGWFTSASLGSSLLGHVLRTSSSKSKGMDNKRGESGEAAPVFKYRLGEEPTSPRPGSPGFQDGHWVSSCVVVPLFVCSRVLRIDLLGGVTTSLGLSDCRFSAEYGNVRHKHKYCRERLVCVVEWPPYKRDEQQHSQTRSSARVLEKRIGLLWWSSSTCPPPFRDRLF